MFGLGIIGKGVRAVATGNTQARLGIQSPHLPGAFVRIGRFLYTGTAIMIGVTSYSAYVNEQTAPGSGPQLILPGRKPRNPPDRADRAPKFAAAAKSQGSGAAGGATGGAGGAAAGAQIGGNAKVGGSIKNHPELKPTISAIGATILRHFPKLVITATTNGNHVSNSYHYQGRAIDFAADPAYMHQAAAWIAANLTSQLVEGIHNPNLSVKNGKVVPPSFWGASVWAGHANHIHVAA